MTILAQHSLSPARIVRKPPGSRGWPPMSPKAKGLARSRSTSISRAPSVSSSGDESLSAGFLGWRWLQQKRERKEADGHDSQASARSRSVSLARTPSEQSSGPMRSRSPAVPRSKNVRKTLIISCCTKSTQWPALQCVAAVGQLPIVNVTLDVQPHGPGVQEPRTPGNQEWTAGDWTQAILEMPGWERLAQKAMAQLYPQSCKGHGNLLVLVSDYSPEAAASLAEVVASWQQRLIGPARAFQFDALLAAKPSLAMAELREWLGPPPPANDNRHNFPATSSSPPRLGLPLSAEAAQSHRRMWRRVRSAVAQCLGIQESRGPRRIRPPPWLLPGQRELPNPVPALSEEEREQHIRSWREKCIYTRPVDHLSAEQAFQLCGTSAAVQQRFWDMADWIPWGSSRDLAMTEMLQQAACLRRGGWSTKSVDTWMTQAVRVAICCHSPACMDGAAQVLPASFYDLWERPGRTQPAPGAPWLNPAAWPHQAPQFHWPPPVAHYGHAGHPW